MIAWWTIVRAVFGYVFLVFIVRIVGRRPGKQLTPFEFVLVFFLGGLTLTGMVGDEVSLTNALCQIVAVAMAHTVLTWLAVALGLVDEGAGWHGADFAGRRTLAQPHDAEDAYRG